MKRLFDVVISIILLPVVFLVVALAALGIYLSERKSPFFFQERVGKNEQVFTIFKLRTMKVETSHVATHEVDKESVTRIGRILRKVKIDELPQLVNVLKGDMSLVGPRPCLSTQSELIEERRKRDVFSISPGVTGPSQVAGIDMSSPVELAKSDAKYLLVSGVRYDLGILIATVLGSGQGDKVR